jgi:hypothetical protein
VVRSEDDEKGVLHAGRWCYSNEVGSNGMKKLFLIVTLSLFGATAVVTAPLGGSVALAQKKDKDEKKNPPGPPVIKDKGSQEKPKEPPPRKDKKP